MTLGEKYTKCDFDLKTTAKEWTEIMIADHGLKCGFFSSPEHEVLMVSYCDQSLSVVRSV